MADVGQRKGVDEIFKEAWDELIKEGVFTKHTDPDKNPRNEELATFLHRFLYKVVVDLTKNGGGTVDSVARESAASAHRRLDAIKKAL